MAIPPGCGRMSAPTRCWWLWNGAAPTGNSWAVAQKVKQFNPMSVPRRTANIFTQKCVHEFFPNNAKKWKQPEYLTSWWIHKMWYIHTVEYYMTIKGRAAGNVLQHGSALKHEPEWEGQTQRPRIVWSAHTGTPVGQSTEAEGRLVVIGGRWEMTEQGKASFWADESVLELSSGDGCTILWIYRIVSGLPPLDVGFLSHVWFPLVLLVPACWRSGRRLQTEVSSIADF